MLLSIHTDGPVPIYEQIVAQLIYSIAAGALEAGVRIPSVRDLSQQLLVNPNTVARAFQELERAGVVVSRRGVGMEVAPDAPKLCRGLRKELVRQRIREALREATASALGTEDIRAMVEEELSQVNGRKRSGDKR